MQVRNTGHLSLLASGWVLKDILAHLTDPALHRPSAAAVAALATAAQRHRRLAQPAAAADAHEVAAQHP